MVLIRDDFSIQKKSNSVTNLKKKIPINLLMVSRWLKVVKMTEISACLQINSQALAPSVSYKGTILKLYPIRTSREEGIPESDFPRYSS